MTVTTQQKNARHAIWNTLELIRARAEPLKAIQIVIFILMWSKFLPQTKGDIIGYFDVLETIDDINKLKIIQNELQKETGIVMSHPYSNFSLFVFNENLNFNNFIEDLRVNLLPAAKLVAKGETEDIENLLSFLKNIIPNMLGKKATEINKGILDFSELIFDDLGANLKELNCLYPWGISSAYNFARKRKTYLHGYNIETAFLNKGLISLYGKPFKFEEYDSKPKEITFAAPEIGLKLSPEAFSKLEEFIIPPFEDGYEESELISDLPCQMMYLAHENTKNTSICMTSSGSLFSNQNGINFFRKKIIDNNWLDAVIKFPPMSYSGTSIPAVLLILKKNRSLKDEVMFIDFSNCDNNSSNKLNLNIPNKEISRLFSIYKKKKKSTISVPISTEEIKRNDYLLFFSKYLVSEEYSKITKLLNKRKTVPLNSLVDFIRPIKITSKKVKNGPEINEVLISDINSIGEITSTNKKTNVSEEFLSKSNLPLVKKNDLVISIKGTLGKVGIISRDLENTIPGPSLCVLRPQDSSIIKGEHIFQYLRSQIGQQIISASNQSISVSFISIIDLKNLPIPVPSLKEQLKAKIISERSQELIESIQKMQKELDDYTNSGWMQRDKKSKDDSS